jgi:hypothetical protein
MKPYCVWSIIVCLKYLVRVRYTLNRLPYGRKLLWAARYSVWRFWFQSLTCYLAVRAPISPLSPSPVAALRSTATVDKSQGHYAGQHQAPPHVRRLQCTHTAHTIRKSQFVTASCNRWLALGSEVLTGLVINSSVFWNVTTYRSVQSAACILLGLIFGPEDGGDMFLQDVGSVSEDKTPWLLVRKQTIPTERPSLVGEVSANFCGWRGVISKRMINIPRCSCLPSSPSFTFSSSCDVRHASSLYRPLKKLVRNWRVELPCCFDPPQTQLSVCETDTGAHPAHQWMLGALPPREKLPGR